MDLNANEQELDSLMDRNRQDMEELISLLDGYKYDIQHQCEGKKEQNNPTAKSDATLADTTPRKECAARASLVKKMVLIKKKSCAQFSTNGFCNKRMDGGDVSETIHEDDLESKGLVPETHATDATDVGNPPCSLGGAVNLADLEDLISLLNDCLLQEEVCKDVVDNTQARPCSEQVRRLSLVEEMLREKRRSNHSNVPVDTCVKGYVVDAHGVSRKVVNVWKSRAPKKVTKKAT